MFSVAILSFLFNLILGVRGRGSWAGAPEGPFVFLWIRRCKFRAMLRLMLLAFLRLSVASSDLKPLAVFLTDGSLRASCCFGPLVVAVFGLR